MYVWAGLELNNLELKKMKKTKTNNKVLLHSTRNYAHYPVITHNGEEYICVCMYN